MFLEKLLTFKVKTIELVKWKKKSVWSNQQEFVYDTLDGMPVLVTHQGFAPWLEKEMRDKGLDVRVENCCVPDLLPPPRLDKMRGFRFSQKKVVTELLLANRSGRLGLPTRYGKCFGKGTPVMMADGSVKAVEEVVTGDFVMGPDSKPRKVEGCTQGRSQLYRIIPNYNGMPWVCNDEHILHVQRTRESKIPTQNKAFGTCENITVKDWLAAPKWFRHVRKMRRVAVDFPEKELPIPPYIYGLWLGDGHSDRVAFTNMEPEVWEAIEKWGASEGLIEAVEGGVAAGRACTRAWVKTRGKSNAGRGSNPLRSWFRKNKKSEGIQEDYKTANRQQRLELLAGILDTDGESNKGSNCGVLSKYKALADDIAWLCNSLGFGAVSRPCQKKAQTGPYRTYWRVGIRGNTNEIPFRVPRKIRIRANKFNPLTTGFKVEDAGYGDYYGFALEDPEGLFLLGDCTVVHNTYCLINILRAYPGVKTVVLAPGQDLLVQLTADLKAALEPEGREIKQIGGGSTVKFMSEDITVCSMDSTHKLDKESVRLVIGDEIHTMASATRQDILLDFPLCRKIGMTASQTGRFDKKDFMIEGLFGPLLAHIPYKEAVIEKAVEQITVLAVDWPVEIANAGMARTTDRDAAMKLVFQGEKLGRCVRWLANTVLPPNWQTLFFIKTEEQADALLNYIGSETAIAMAKKLSKKERNAMTEKVRHNHISRVICSDIFVQGVTFHDVVCLVNCAGGGASTTTIQKPGRLAEIRPNKSGSLLVDFDIRPGNAVAMECQGVLQLWRETQARLASYRDTGYHVVQVKPAMFLRTLIALGISFDGVTPRLPE